MEPLAALMLLITCTDANTGCQQHQPATRTYESVAACEEHIVSEMMSLGVSPRVFGQCIELGDKPIEDVAWRVSSGGELMVTLADASIQLASLASR